MISNILKSLVKYIEKVDSVIDIGCDHALLDIYLVKNNIIDKCIVSDVSQNALKQGIENIEKYNLSDREIPQFFLNWGIFITLSQYIGMENSAECAIMNQKNVAEDKI